MNSNYLFILDFKFYYFVSKLILKKDLNLKQILMIFLGREKNQKKIILITEFSFLTVSVDDCKPKLISIWMKNLNFNTVRPRFCQLQICEVLIL